MDGKVELRFKKLMEVFIVKYSSLYLFLALVMAVSLAAVAGCGKVTPAGNAPVSPDAPVAPVVVPAPVVPPAARAHNLVITKVWLDGLMVYYTIKNVGVGDSPQTQAYIYVNDLNPAQGGSSFVDALKPGQEKSLNFSNYQWPYGREFGATTEKATVNPAGYIELPLQNHTLKVCADGKDAIEAIKINHCKDTVVGIMWEYDLLPISNMATWRNADGDYPEPGSENNVNGAHFKIANTDMGGSPQLETIPKQVPQGWMQGTWGYFYADEFGARRVTAIKVPAKLHFVARVGLARNAIGSDGVTYKFGIKDINDTVTWIDSKKATTPEAFEDWDIDLSKYEGQKYYFILRVDAGASPVNDFAIWNQAKLIQVND
jgi:hypothetical protein